MSKLGAFRQIGLVILFAVGGQGGGALAQGTPEERSACMDDAFKFCLSDIPNVSAIEACLRSNENALSPACRAEFKPTGRTRLKAEHFR